VHDVGATCNMMAEGHSSAAVCMATIMTAAATAALIHIKQ
jgi:hypothetical protein